MRPCIEWLEIGSHVRRNKDHSDIVELSSDFVSKTFFDKKQDFATIHSTIELMQPLNEVIFSHSCIWLADYRMSCFSICTRLQNSFFRTFS